MLQEIIDTYEYLKKYIFIIESEKTPIILSFQNEHFFHLLGLHKLNLDIYFPKKITNKANQYKYIKKMLKNLKMLLRIKFQDSI